MSQYNVRLDTVQVTDGQGAGEGDFELRVQVSEGSHQAVWPSLNGSVKVDQNGPAQSVGDVVVGKYTVMTGSLTKTFNVDVTEVDGGTLGKDDTGHGSITFTLTPGMQSSTKSCEVPLKRPKMNYHGKVRVTLAVDAV